MEGGIPAGNVVLIAGESGTMKSALAYHMAFENARRENHRALYVTLNQPRSNLVRDMEGLGMRLDAVDDRLAVADLGLLRMSMRKELRTNSWTDVIKMYSQNLKLSVGYDLLILDSLSVLETLSGFRNPREELFQFYEWLRGLDVTTILSYETIAGDIEFGIFGEDYLADGIIHMMMVKVNEDTIQRRIRIVKMRSTNHSTNFFSLIVSRDGFRVARVIAPVEKLSQPQSAKPDPTKLLPRPDWVEHER
jgi:KaiC/GvpD/RAD55 family RecA-like ATPase